MKWIISERPKYVFLFIFFCIFFTSNIFSQKSASIKGRLSDKNGSIGFADVALYAAKDSTKALKYATSDSTGSFFIDKIPFGQYKLTAHLLGYKMVSEMMTITKTKPNISLGNITMEPDVTTLGTITVTAQSKLIDNKIDKMVYNAEKDITSQTGVATDVLKKIPQVSVDVDGNVELQGNSSIRFFIDGKPSTILGSNITDVLQAIPANQIKSIEVITTPGAKYDAQGTGGIINIILKHNTLEGVNGNVSLTAASLVQNGSFNFNVRKGKFGMNLFANGNLRPSVESPSSYNRVSTDTATNTNSILNQIGTGSFDRHGLQSGIGFDWSPDELNTFSGALSYNNFGVRSTGFVNQTEQTQAVSGGDYLDTKSINNTNRSFRQYSYDPSLNYKHSFKNKDQQLEFAADGSFANNMISSGNDQFLQPQDSLFYGTRNTNPAKEKEYEIKADYTQPVGKDVVFGAGGKFSGYDINTTANALVWNPNSMSYLYSPALSNDLNYHQKVYAAYAELTFPVGKLLESRLGARYERTQVNAFYANSRQKVQNGYNTVVPTIFLMKKIDENQTVKLNFTIRIGRPDYRDLNPYINASDPKNITTGNPNLKPEIWDLYEASYIRELGKIGSLMFTLFYRQSNGDIQQFLVYYPSIQIGDTIYNNVSVGTRENIGVEDNMGANLFFDFHINNKFNIQSNISYYYRHTINRINPGYNSNAMFYRSNINSSYHFTDHFAAEFFGSFSSRHHEIQGYFPSFVSYSFALRKNFLNDKLSVALTANNIFSKYVNQRTSLYGPGFQSTETRDIPFRTFGINFTWKFGELQSEKEKHNENPLNISAPE